LLADVISIVEARADSRRRRRRPTQASDTGGPAPRRPCPGPRVALDQKTGIGRKPLLVNDLCR
jgi:hypothetical protein